MRDERTASNLKPRASNLKLRDRQWRDGGEKEKERKKEREKERERERERER
jgi:hypothetical protein